MRSLLHCYITFRFRCDSSSPPGGQRAAAREGWWLGRCEEQASRYKGSHVPIPECRGLAQPFPPSRNFAEYQYPKQAYLCTRGSDYCTASLPARLPAYPLACLSAHLPTCLPALAPSVLNWFCIDSRNKLGHPTGLLGMAPAFSPRTDMQGWLEARVYACFFPLLVLFTLIHTEIELKLVFSQFYSKPLYLFTM